jgi:hypothetical protein
MTTVLTGGAFRSRRRGWVVLVAALLALGATVAVRPPHAPPLYDGIGFPDEPYRWVTPPPGETKAAAPATPARATIQVTPGGSGGQSQASRGFSSEQGPQVAFSVAEGAFSPPAKTTSIDLIATPKAPPAPYGNGGRIVSNLYELSALADGKDGADVPLAPGAAFIVNLRASAQTQQTVVLCTWDGTAWNQVATRQVGTEIYAAQLATLDPIALVRLDQGVRPTVAAPEPTSGATAPPADATGDASSGTSNRTLLLTVGGIVVLLAGALLVLRRRTGDG